MSAENFDWSSFTIRINIKSSTEKLYHAWATQQGIENWFLRLSEYKNPNGKQRTSPEYAQAGDTYCWRWHGWPDEVTEYGELLECNGLDFFSFRFGNAGNVAIRIYDELDEKIVELVQSNIATDEKSKQDWHIGCKTGWTFYLANLKSLMEGGIDLRNKNVQMQNVISA